LESGLAIVYGSSLYENSYKELENEAKNKKIGLWGSKVKLDSLRDDFHAERTITKLNEQKNVILSEIVSSNEFYLQDP